jgi:hypothetical protein
MHQAPLSELDRRVATLLARALVRDVRAEDSRTDERPVRDPYATGRDAAHGAGHEQRVQFTTT